MKHVRETLRLLHGHFRMAAVAASKAEHLELMHHSGLLQFFEFVITREHHERSKPDPEPISLHSGVCS
jgi:beta-phosphoglucomutase-like phosphatase (HAD superfamily)